MATPTKKISDPAKKPESLVIIPDSVADFTPSLPAPELSAHAIAAPAAILSEFGTTIETATKTVADADISARAKNIQNTNTEINKTMDKAIKTAEEFVSFGQGNIEAIMKSNQIWMTGLQDMSKALAATAQATMEETVSTMKTFAGLRSIKDAIDLQTSFARTSFEKALSESGKMTETSMKLAEQAMAPITARVTVAMEKFGKTV